MITRDEAWDIIEKFADDSTFDDEDISKLIGILKPMISADEEQTYRKKCMKCGKEFTTMSKRQRICPDCKKKAQREAEKRYAGKKQEKDVDMTLHEIAQESIRNTAKELALLGEDK